MERDFPHAARERAPLRDAFGRRISYLRLSVTDRCNLRCRYCMGDAVKFLPKADVLTLEELQRISEAFVRLGVSKLRITGGEPLARPGVLRLIERLGTWLGQGLDELTLTTNGTLLERNALALRAAGVRRVNVSLDTLDAGRFQALTGHDQLDSVLAGIRAARGVGLHVRLNAVAQTGVNEDEFDRLLRWCGEYGCDLALIELMPLGGGASAGPSLSLDGVRRRLEQRWTLQPLDSGDAGPATYARVAETGMRIGFISPLSHAFCRQCNRVRLTCIGRLVLCLGQGEGLDLRALLRRGAPDAELEGAILRAVEDKPLQHHFASRPAAERPVTPMWQMGG